MKDDLNDRQRRFVEAMLVDPNATQAAIRAGYSARSARNQARRLMTNDDVRAALAKEREARAERTRVSADKVVKELARLAFTDMRDFVEWGGDSGAVLTFKPSAELHPDDSAAVTEVKLTPGQFGTTMQIKLGHKDSALRMLAEHVGLFNNAGVDMSKLADAFMYGVHTVKAIDGEDLSEP